MTDKLNLAEYTIDPYISPVTARTLVQEILDGQPGLFPITGQAGTGKTTTLFMIAYRAWQQGYPITVLSTDQELLDGLHFTLPSEWNTQLVNPSEQNWLNAVQQIITQSSSSIVIDQLGGDNIKAALVGVQAGRWVFTCVDTPFVGVDVLYNLRAWGFTSQEIVSTLAGVLSQMLLPRLCGDCGKLSPASLEETRLVYPDSFEARELWHETGCSVCSNRGIGGSWRYGRCAAFEVLRIDAELRPLLENFLEHNLLNQPPSNKHYTLRNCTRELVQNGMVGIQTYQREVLQNPLLRIQHLWEQESLRASRIQQMFGRFVTQHLVERIMSQTDFERIIEGEHRYVTCFFCDVRGFTTLSEQSSPIEIFITLNQYFREIIDIVFQHEGTIDKFIGDSIMVMFGAPVQQTDQELRAVQCAIAIQQKVTEINQQQQISPLQVGIGINSGTVVAGCLGSDLRMDYTILGDVVNTAARLESQAQPGQILLGPATHRAVEEQIECRSVGSLSLKGKAAPLEAFEVV